jgi:calmodulin
LLPSGTIELDKLQQVMNSVGQNPTREELIEMRSTVDDNGDNEIDFNEFLILMKSHIKATDPETQLEKVLKDVCNVFETTGGIDRNELKKWMKKLGQVLPYADLIALTKELHAMMNEVHTIGDGEMGVTDPETELEKVLKDVCNVFETNDGIDRNEFKKWTKKLGQALPEAELLYAIIIEANGDDDGEISFDEFKALMQN